MEAFMKRKAGLLSTAAAAVLILCLVPWLGGCGGNRDRVDTIKAQGELVAAVAEEEGEMTRDQEYARELERQVLEELAWDMNVILRYEVVAEEELPHAVEEGLAHVAAGALVLPGGREEGYSVTYGRRAAFIAAVTDAYLSTRGELANSTVGYTEGTGNLVRRQISTVAGTRMMPAEGAEEGAEKLRDGTFSACLCYEKEARELMDMTGIQVQELSGLVPETYAFYIGEGEYRLQGLVNQILTRKLTE